MVGDRLVTRAKWPKSSHHIRGPRGLSALDRPRGGKAGVGLGKTSLDDTACAAPAYRNIRGIVVFRACM